MSPAHHPQELLTRTALGVFRLNGQFITVSDGLAREAGLTAARWQVLGAALREPQSVAQVARTMGITRQSVQRIADVLVEQGLAEYRPNPAHRRAKLLQATEAGRTAVRQIDPGHARLANRLLDELGPEEFAGTVRVLEQLSKAMAAIEAEDADRTEAADRTKGRRPDEAPGPGPGRRVRT